MNSFPSSRRTRAFTLMEILTVVAIIGILATLLLPALSEARARAKRAWCANNLEQVGIAFHMFANDHGGKFPMQTPLSNGGSQEFVQNGYLVNGEFYFAFRQFQVVSNALSTPEILICPADLRQPALDFGALQNSNLSYFIGVNARPVESRSILAGDRNITNSPSRNPTIIQGGTGGRVWWTQELHRFKGNVLFADTHVEEWNEMAFDLGTNGPLAAADLFLPSVKSEMNQSWSSPANSRPGGTPATPPNSDSSNCAEPQPELQPAALTNSQPDHAMDNSISNPMECETISVRQTPSPSSSGGENITRTTATGQSVGAIAPSDKTNSAMSPFDRRIVQSLQTYAGPGYLLLVLLLLLLLLLFQARRRWRRWRQRKKR